MKIYRNHSSYFVSSTFVIVPVTHKILSEVICGLRMREKQVSSSHCPINVRNVETENILEITDSEFLPSHGDEAILKWNGGQHKLFT